MQTEVVNDLLIFLPQDSGERPFLREFSNIKTVFSEVLRNSKCAGARRIQ